MSIYELVKNGERTLSENNILDAYNNALDIFLFVTSISKEKYFTIFNDNVDSIINQQIVAKYFELIKLRAKSIPIQYIFEKAPFYGMDFYVNNNVLIPRFDTEILVDQVIKRNKNINDISILDMCTGSGCIAITLSKYLNAKTIIGTDISEKTLYVSNINKDNICKNNKNLFFYQSDGFNSIKDIMIKHDINYFDVITINPPYIKTNVIKELDKEVRDFEPLIALDGGDDGLTFYRIISKNAKNYMGKNSELYLEIGYDQALDIKLIFESDGYKVLDIIKDNANNDRAIIIKS